MKTAIPGKHFAKTLNKHSVKSVHIWSYSGPYFHVFRRNTERISPYLVRMRENADQNYFEYGHFLRSESQSFRDILIPFHALPMWSKSIIAINVRIIQFQNPIHTPTEVPF